MLKLLKFALSLFIFCISHTSVLAQRLAPFGSETHLEKIGDRINRIPYESTLSYFECINVGNEFVQMNKSKATYVIYFFVDDSLTELGIQVLSPVPELTSPNKGHIATEDFFNNCKNKNEGFNSFIRISKSESHYEQQMLVDLKTEPIWNLLGENDDSNEMNNPENSLIRILNAKNNLFLSPGIYKVEISVSGKGALEGSFLLQAGSIPAKKLSPIVSDWRKL